jgi:transporter family-2 protein
VEARHGRHLGTGPPPPHLHARRRLRRPVALDRPAHHDDVAATATVTAVIVGAGVLGAIQPKINAVLADRIDSWLLASLVNFAAAFVGLHAMLALRPQTRRRLRDLRRWPVPRWTFLAGLGGVGAVVAAAVTVERIGVAVFSVAFYAGQIVAGLLVDRFGIGAGGAQPIGAARVRAAVLALAAVAAAQSGRRVGELAPLLVLVVVAAGVGAALQSACNGRIARAVGDPFAPTAVNVTVGLSALTLLTVVAASSGHLDGPRWPSEPWLYAGGLLGVTNVVSLAFGSAAVGVFRTTIGLLAGQLTTAFVVDAVVEHRRPTAGVLVGAALIVLAVALTTPAATARR